MPLCLPSLVFDSHSPRSFPGALGLSAMIAITLGVTTETIGRGPVGRVSPITGPSSALTAILAFAVLGERPISTWKRRDTENICTPHDPRTERVSLDGRELAVEPVDSVPLSRRYLLS